MGWQQGTGLGGLGIGGGGVLRQCLGRSPRQTSVRSHTHMHTRTCTRVQTTRGHTKTTTSTRKHHPHHPSQVVQLERRIKKKRRALLSTAAWNWLGKSLQPSLHATHHQTLREKPRTNSFKQKQERFSKNVCHCKTCLHAFTCPCWHSFTYC